MSGAAFDCAPGRTAATPSPVPHIWAAHLESALSVATIAPTRCHVDDVRALLRRVPGEGLCGEWRALVLAADRWLQRVDAVPVPPFGDFSALDAACAARPQPVRIWQRAHAAISGE